MKNSLLIFLFALSSLAALAQGNPNWWFTDLQLAQEKSKESKLPILLVFTGSDWCRPCIKLKNRVLDSPFFHEYAAEHLIVLYLDFPARKPNLLSVEQREQNEQLAAEFNGGGVFPRLVAVSSKMEVLSFVHYRNETAEEFIELCRKIRKEEDLWKPKRRKKKRKKN